MHHNSRIIHVRYLHLCQFRCDYLPSPEVTMEVTQRELVTIVHGMLFGGFFLMAIGGAIVMLLEWSSPGAETLLPPAARWRTIYLITMVVLGWAAVLTGAYVVYPWYRAAAPAGADLAAFPQRLLIIQSQHRRLAHAGDGMEGTRRVVRAYGGYHGRLRHVAPSFGVERRSTVAPGCARIRCGRISSRSHRRRMGSNDQ